MLSMATDTIFSVPNIAPPTMSGARLENVTGVDVVEKVQATGDDRSSSLSELGDPAGIERSSRAGSEANDTEAETERLEDSPQKQRSQRDVVLTSTNGTYTDHQNQPVADAIPENSVGLGQSVQRMLHRSWLTAV